MEMLTAEQFLIQQNGGTWSELFDRAALINRYEWLTVLLWLAAFRLLGVFFFPLTSAVFGKLRDRGYGISAFFGLMCCGWMIWFAAFFGFTYTREHILWTFAGFALINIGIALLRRKELRIVIQKGRSEFLRSELVFLGCFAAFLLIRYGNPDLWHPYKGGERPMDFSYFNAILKSTIFPPYDPWFGGGYLNYYYYGIYLSGVMVKLLGVVPSTAFNLILATWYAFLGTAAYSLGVTLYAAARPEGQRSHRAGLFSLAGMQVLGNFGTVVQIIDELVELGAGVPADQVQGFMTSAAAFFTGIAKRFQGEPLRMYRGDWYWVPSRAIPDTSITEFPFFTFLYGDPHAHLFALPMTVLVLLWLTVMILRMQENGQRRFLSDLGMIVCGAFLIGSLIPTNTWDMPTYLCISVVVMAAFGWVWGFFGKRKDLWRILLAVCLLIGLTFAFFLPYLQTNYRENEFGYWDETRTPIGSYLKHWGLFLFMILSWYAIETYYWMAETPLSAYRAYKAEHRGILSALILLAALMFGALLWIGVRIAWIALPLMIWSAVLLMRKKTDAVRRFVIFLIGTALFATLLVEVIHLSGDYGRMNTVFKFYNQVWVILSVCGAFAFTQVLDWLDFIPASGKSAFWRVVCTLWVFGCALYPLAATIDKVTDRMSDIAPHTLDGMKYMETSQYWQDGFLMDLSQDYDAIRWMQENIQGSPLIIEANATEYKFGSRFTMYTGLPGLIGWNYHQRQQRGPISSEVWKRVEQVGEFYNTTDPNQTTDFLKKYSPKYIIVGQMERGMYTAEGIAKFDALNGELWRCIYDHQDTKIYEVL